MHFHARAMAFDWRTRLLVVAGDGSPELPAATAVGTLGVKGSGKGGGGGAPVAVGRQDVTLSLWSYEGGKLKLVRALGEPQVRQEDMCVGG